MDLLNFTWYYIIVFLLVLSVLISVHEAGHFLVARMCGVRVQVFSIGFGPEIYGWTDRTGTRWKIGYLPLGGYVKMFGMEDESTIINDEGEQPLSPEERDVSFQHKPLGQRAAIVAAGPVANFILAIMIFTGVFTFVGTPLVPAFVGEVVPDSAAAEGGLQPGDQILFINEEPVNMFDDLLQIVTNNPGVPLQIVVRRNDTETTLTATPNPTKVKDESGETVEIGRLGVISDPTQVYYERKNIFSATWQAFEHTGGIITQTLSVVGEMITGQRNSDDLGGILRIAMFSGKVAQAGIVSLLSFTALLSINLGLINLFPVPVLDGGHLVFFAAEAIRGRPLGPRVQEYGLRFGLILVFLLMVFVTWNDLVYLRVVEFFQKLIS